MINFIITPALWTAFMGVLTLKSPDFNDNGFIPAKFTCDSSNVNPTIIINDIPKKAKSLAIIVEDPDTPLGIFDHWIMWNIPPENQIMENSTPGVQGKNGKDENGYTGPCPPGGTHHYIFRVLALDTELNLQEGANKQALEKAMKDHIIAVGTLTGLYKKDKP